MKRQYRFLLLAVLLLPLTLNAQRHYNITVGNGREVSFEVPVGVGYMYSISESIYHADEIGLDGVIDTLWYHLVTGSTDIPIHNLTIYMAEVNRGSFSEEDSLLEAGLFREVFRGDVQMAGGWVPIALDSMFVYQDTADLIIAMIDEMDENSGLNWFVCYGYRPTDGTRSIVASNMTHRPSLSNPRGDCNVVRFLPDIRLGITSTSPNCDHPEGVTVSGVTGSYATISWEGNGADRWELVVSDSAVTDFSDVNTLETDLTSYTITALNANTQYYVYVRTLCSMQDSSVLPSVWTTATTFRTACTDVTGVPYIVGFEGLEAGELPDCWTLVKYDSLNFVQVPGVYNNANDAHGGTVSLHFGSSLASTEIVALPAMLDINTLELCFYASVMSSAVMMEAGVMEDTLFVPVDTVELIVGSFYMWYDGYHRYSVNYSRYAGTGQRMAFRVTCNRDYDLLLDDVTVRPIPACMPPSPIQVIGVTASETTLGWPDNNLGWGWDVAYGASGFNPDTAEVNRMHVNNNTAVLRGLTPGVSYEAYVRTDCGEQDSPWEGPLAFLGGEYRMRLDGTDTLHACGITVRDDGGGRMGLYTPGANATVVIYPASEDSVVTIYGNVNIGNTAVVSIYDGVGVNGLLLWNASENDSIPLITSYAGPVTVHFADYEEGRGNFTLYTGCAARPLCAPVYNLRVDNVGSSSVHMAWDVAPTDWGVPTRFTLEAVNEALDSVEVTGTSTTHSGTLTGLSPNTRYKVRVRSECVNTDYGQWDSVEVVTHMAPCLAVDSTAMDSILIGEGGTELTYRLPVFLLSRYSYSQQIITAQEMMSAAVVRGIEFDYSGTYQTYTKTNVTIYLAHTMEETLDGGFVDFDSNTFVKVYTGSLNCVPGWNHFEFDRPFQYDGQNNLLIAVHDNSAGHEYIVSNFRAHVAENKARYVENLFSPINIQSLSPSSGYGLDVCVNMRLSVDACTENGNCAAPMVMVDSVGSDRIVLSWTPGISGTMWHVEHRAAGDTAWTDDSLTTEMSYVFGGLQPNTQYRFRISSLCTGEEYATIRSARTHCAPLPVPFAYGFEDLAAEVDSIPSCWKTISIGGSSFETTDETVYHGNRSYLMQSSHSGGESYLVLPLLAADVDSLELSFWMRRNNPSTGSEVVVGVMSDPADVGTFVPLGRVVSQVEEGWEPKSFRLNGYHGTGGFIAIASPRGVNTQQYIDDIYVDYYSPCPRVENVSVLEVGIDTAVIAWHGDGSGDYEIEYGPAGFELGTGTRQQWYGDTVVIGGLAPNTEYEFRVRSVCVSGDTALWSFEISFHTQCAMLSAVPFVEDFDNLDLASAASTFIPCWTKSENAMGYISIDGLRGRGESQCLMWSCMSGAVRDRYIALPAVDTSVLPINNLQLSLWGRNVDRMSPCKLLVGMMSDPTMISTFETIDTVLLTNEVYSEYVVPLDGYTGQGTYVAIWGIPNGISSWYCFIDDIRLDSIPSCIQVSRLTQLSNSEDTVTIGWTDRNGATQWAVSIKNSPEATPTTDTVVSGAPMVTFTELDGDSVYYVWVRALCSSEDVSAWVGPMQVMLNSWLMQPNQSDTVYMCGGTIYDDGGPRGNYANGQNSIVVVRPREANSVLTVRGMVMADARNDYLTVYEGEGTGGRVLWSSMGSTGLTRFGPLLSEQGPVTVQFVSNNSNNHDGFEMRVECISNTCRVRTPRLDGAVAPSSSSLALLWDDIGAIGYEVMYDTAGFPFGSGTMVYTATNSLTVTGLMPATAYDFYIRSICAVGDTGDWVPYTFQTQLCDGVEVVDCYDTDSSSIGNQDIPVGSCQYVYTYSQNLIDSAYLSGMSAAIIAIGCFPKATTDPDWFRGVTVYMANVRDTDLAEDFIVPDEDHRFVKVIDSTDMTFNEWEWRMLTLDTPFFWDGHSNLLVAFLRGTPGATGPYVPFNSRRVSKMNCRYIKSQRTPIDINNPGAAMGYARAERYAADIRLYSCGLTNCYEPSIFGIVSGTESASFTWYGNGDNYEVNIKEADIPFWPEPVSVVGTNYTFYRLTPNTSYDVRVRQDCSADGLGKSEWISDRFTTLRAACVSPSNFHAIGAEGGDVTLDWTPTSSETAWQIRVWSVRGYNEIFTATEHPYTLHDLPMNTTYYLSIRSVCDEDSNLYSEWTPDMSLTVRNEGVEETEGTACTIYPNPANGVVTIGVSGVTGRVRILVTDMNGRTIATETLECSSDCVKTMDVEHLSRGAYFVRITGVHVNMVKKLIIR